MDLIYAEAKHYTQHVSAAQREWCEKYFGTEVWPEDFLINVLRSIDEPPSEQLWWNIIGSVYEDVFKAPPPEMSL